MQIEVAPRTGHQGAQANLRAACRGVAKANEFTHFAVPNISVLDGSWLVYEMRDLAVVLVQTTPTRAAAEMWMLHRG